MGKRGGAATKKPSNISPGLYAPVTLREEVTGKLKTKGANVKSKLKLEHLQKLAVWATKDASIPSLGAFFGHHLASTGELLGLPPDPSLILCQRCETVLQPGFNCTIRIEKNRAKGRNRHRKSSNITQNNVVFRCHYCSHPNLKRGTPKGHLKQIYPLKEKPSSKSKARENTLPKSGKPEKCPGDVSKKEANTVDVLASPAAAAGIHNIDNPQTPTVNSTSLLDTKRWKRRKPTPKKPAEPESNSATSAGTSNKKRKRKWTTLKEIAQSSEHSGSRNVIDFAIPLFL